MLIPFETLIDGVVATLTDTVLPDLQTGFARGQLYAAVDVLRNMRDRIEEKAALRDAELESARAALAAAAAVLRDAVRDPATAAGGTVTAARATAGATVTAAAGDPAYAPRVERAIARAEVFARESDLTAMRAGLVELLEIFETLPVAVARAARAPIAMHLAAQTMRDTAVLKPSMLNEISRG